MNRSLVIPVAMALCLYAVPSAHAHHSHPYFYDQCRIITIEGQAESIRWIDPHTLVVLRLDDGRAYTIDWNPQSRLTNNGLIGPAKAALMSGARIAVSGNPIRTSAEIRQHFPDYTQDVNPNTVDPMSIRRTDGSWNWTRTAADRMPTASPPGCADPAKK